VLLVILLFLGNLRASLIAALTIPLSVLLALSLMYFANVSLTVMTARRGQEMPKEPPAEDAARRPEAA